MTTTQLFYTTVRGIVVVRWTAGQQFERSILTSGMIHNKIQLIRPGCPRLSIALQVQNHGLKQNSFPFYTIVIVSR